MKLSISQANEYLRRGRRFSLKRFKDDVVFDVRGFRVFMGYVEALTCDGWLMILANRVYLGSEYVEIVKTAPKTRQKRRKFMRG